jgi:outer membrane protein assembly factor BamE (lipoprotein component of BamABCDE complex)
MGIAALDVNMWHGSHFHPQVSFLTGRFHSVLSLARRARKPLLVACLAGMAVTACARDSAVRGNLPRPEKLEQVKVGLSTRNDVRELLGPPSNIGTFNDNAWYYISQTTVDVPMSLPEVKDRSITAVYFDSQGIVTDIKHLDQTAGRDISPVARTTPSAGHEPSLLHDLFGNIGKVGAGSASSDTGGP